MYNYRSTRLRGLTNMIGISGICITLCYRIPPFTGASKNPLIQATSKKARFVRVKYDGTVEQSPVIMASLTPIWSGENPKRG